MDQFMADHFKVIEVGFPPRKDKPIYPFQIVWVEGDKRTTSIGGYSKQDMVMCATRLMSFEPDDQFHIEVLDNGTGTVVTSVYRDEIVDHEQE